MKQEFHLSVKSEMKRVKARILEAPKLEYKNQLMSVKDGVWRMQNLKFKEAVKTLKENMWTILSLTKFRDNIRDNYNIREGLEIFMQNLIQNGKVYEK